VRLTYWSSSKPLEAALNQLGGWTVADGERFRYGTAAERRRKNYLRTPLRVFSFALDTSNQERLLAANYGRGDYTTVPALAVPEEGSCVDDNYLARFAKEAKAREASRQEDVAKIVRE